MHVHKSHFTICASKFITVNIIVFVNVATSLPFVFRHVDIHMSAQCTVSCQTFAAKESAQLKSDKHCVCVRESIALIDAISATFLCIAIHRRICKMHFMRAHH